MHKILSTKEFLKIMQFIIASALVVLILYFVTNRIPDEGEKIGEGAVARGTFKIDELTMDVNVGNDHSYEVSEVVTITLPQETQNISLLIPSGNFRIYDVVVEDTAYYTDIGRDSSSIVIVDPFKLTEGNHTYTIRYTIREFEDRDSKKDIFYFSAIMPSWRQPIENIDIKLKFPSDFPWDDLQCYAGQFGVQDTYNRIEFDTDETSKTATLTGENIPENFGITFKAELPDGYWQNPLNGRWVISAIAGIMSFVLLLLMALWLAGGRDPRVEKRKETRPIEGLLPCEQGYIFNGRVEVRDIIMLIMYFGSKGYLKISEYEPMRYRIIRKEDPTNEEKLYRNAYNILFEDVYKNRAVEMENLGERLERMRYSLKDDIAAGYSAPDSMYFTRLSRIFRYISIGALAFGLGMANALSYKYEYLSINRIESLLVMILFAFSSYALCITVDRREYSADGGNILDEIFAGAATLAVVAYASLAVLRRTGSLIASLGIVMTSVLSVFFILIMRARGKDNAEIVSRIKSLRDYIYHPTPKELLENHLSDDNYYYDMLIYALSAGAEESWAISFLTLEVPDPGWYSHDVTGHAFSNLRDENTTLDYAKDLKTFMRTIENAFAELVRRRHRR